jgi:hypothetical protein
MKKTPDPFQQRLMSTLSISGYMCLDCGWAVTRPEYHSPFADEHVTATGHRVIKQRLENTISVIEPRPPNHRPASRKK